MVSVQQAFAAAGGATGLFQGLWRAASQELLVHHQLKQHAGGRQVHLNNRTLLNMLIVGDKGCGKTSLAHAFAGRQEPATPTRLADFVFVEQAEADGSAASVTLWHLGGRQDAAEFDSCFFSLASAFMIVYDPGAGQYPAESLEFWLQRCCGQQDLILSSLPVVVVASSRPGVSPRAQQEQTALAEARQWCAENGGVPHILVHGLQDEHSIQQAFTELLRIGLRRHQRRALGPAAGLKQLLCEVQSPHSGSVSQGAAGLVPSEQRKDPHHQHDHDLPALMQTELGAALLTLRPKGEVCLLQRPAALTGRW